ncbi:MAG: Gfo/Idh/MocA family protein [Thermoguttaceae bacterium]
MTVKLVIVGAGRLGSFHAEKASKHPEVKITGVMDSDPQRGITLAAKHGVRYLTSIDEVASYADAVVIAAPTQHHFALGAEFLSRGIHVLMEKPLAYSFADARALVELAKQQKVVLQVGHVEQFNPAWSAAAPVLEYIRKGNRAIITAERTSGYTFRSTDIGVVHDLMVHDLDLVLSVVPSDIRSIEAAGFYVIGNPEQSGKEDIATAAITFENGTVAVLRASRVEATASRTMRIQAAHLSANIDFASRRTQILRASQRVADGEFGPDMISDLEAVEIAKTFMQDQFSTLQLEQDAVDALSLEMEDFVHAVKRGQAPQVSGLRALNAVSAADAIVEAIVNSDRIEKLEKRLNKVAA